MNLKIFEKRDGTPYFGFLSSKFLTMNEANEEQEADK